MADERRGFGSPFTCAPGLRIEAHERLSALQFQQIQQQLGKIEAGMERLEKRLWLAAYGVVGVILAQAMQSILAAVP
jgi:hypothetical protein